MVAWRKLWKFLNKICKPYPAFIDYGTVNQTDKFSFLEKLNSKETISYIRRENRYATLQLWHSIHFQRAVQKIIKSICESLHENNTDELYERKGKYDYFSEVSDNGFPLVYRRKVNSKGAKEIVLDAGALGNNPENSSFGPIKVSASEKFIAVIVTQTHSGNSDCHVYRITAKFPDLICKIKDILNVEWCNNDKTLILTSCDFPNVTNYVKKYCLINNTSEMILKEIDTRFSIDIMKSRDEKYILIHSNSKLCSEVHALNADFPDQEIQCIQRRDDWVECYVDHWRSHFYAIKSTALDSEYKIERRCSNSEKRKWETFYPQNKSKAVIQDMELFSDYCVVYELQNLIPQVTIVQLDNPCVTQTHQTANHCAVMETYSNQDPHSKAVKYSISSPINPPSLFELYRNTQTLNEIFKSSVCWDSSNYSYCLLEAKSKDNTHVPISIFHAKNIKDLDNSPMLASVYGSYGVQVDMCFSPERSFLLSRGWILAFPHVRGGGELGRKWYKSATKLTKKKTFEDLEQCIKKLHSSGYSTPKKTALSGTSAGGLAVATLCNTAPNLFKAALLKVPFVDISNSMMNDKLNLTKLEHEELGDPRSDTEDMSNILSYCPFHNLHYHKDFPSVYSMTVIDDDRVPAWMPLKWTAKWRRLEYMGKKQEEHLVLCRTYKRGGHFGVFGYQSEKKISEMIAFLYTALDIPMKL